VAVAVEVAVARLLAVTVAAEDTRHQSFLWHRVKISPSRSVAAALVALKLVRAVMAAEAVVAAQPLQVVAWDGAAVQKAAVVVVVAAMPQWNERARLLCKPRVAEAAEAAALEAVKLAARAARAAEQTALQDQPVQAVASAAAAGKQDRAAQPGARARAE
jgi:hypothetical protein